MTDNTRPAASRKEWDFFGLPRPQYPPAPELLISSLAWCMTELGRPPPKITEIENQGIVYQRVPQPKHSKRLLQEMAPARGGDAWNRVEGMLISTLALQQGDVEKATEILVEDLVGNVPPKAHSRAVIPFNAHVALMQDSRGMLGVDNPPNLALVIQRMFVLGGGKGGAAQHLAQAFTHIYDQGQDDWLEKATETMVPNEIALAASELLKKQSDCEQGRERPPDWLRDIPSPFRWFAASWQNLMDNDWKDKMPRRRWVDWATCVLRTALGTGYMFEMSFYYRLVLSLTSDDTPRDAAEKILGTAVTFFPWESFASISTRDVASRMNKTCDRGMACRSLLQDWIVDNPEPCPSPLLYLDADGLARWIKDARDWLASSDKDAHRDAMRQAIAGAAEAKNMRETISYSLVDRGKAGVSEDLYSLLNKRGPRYTVVEPGQEWLVVVSSLQAKNAGGRTRVVDVIGALEELGVKTGYNTIVRELERAGLARTSHDADDAIEVVAAF